MNAKLIIVLPFLLTTVVTLGLINLPNVAWVGTALFYIRHQKNNDRPGAK